MKNFNALKVYMRALSLAISFCLVITVIAYLQSGEVKSYIDSKARDFGLGGPAPQTPAGLKSHSFRLCRTRIDSLEWSNQARIFEDKSQAKARWLSQVPGSAPHELDYLEVEKWFGINCMVKVFELPKIALRELTPLPDYLVIKFVDGTESHLKKSAHAEFLFDQDFFKSPELASSLHELYHLGSIDLSEPK